MYLWQKSRNHLNYPRLSGSFFGGLSVVQETLANPRSIWLTNQSQESGPTDGVNAVRKQNNPSLLTSRTKPICFADSVERTMQIRRLVAHFPKNRVWFSPSVRRSVFTTARRAMQPTRLPWIIHENASPNARTTRITGRRELTTV